MKKIHVSLMMIGLMMQASFQLSAYEYPFEEYVNRRANCGDVLFLLEVTNAIERSKASEYVVVYPYVMREKILHETINDQALFVAADPDNQVVSMLTLFVLKPEETTELMNATLMKDWQTMYNLNDVYLFSGTWYTEPVLRNRGIFTSLLAYALQASAARVANYMREHGSKRVYLMVGMVEDAINHELCQHLVNTMKNKFADFIESLRAAHFANTTKPIYSLSTLETTKPFYDLEANELNLIKTSPAKRYMLAAQLQ